MQTLPLADRRGTKTAHEAGPLANELVSVENVAYTSREHGEHCRGALRAMGKGVADFFGEAVKADGLGNEDMIGRCLWPIISDSSRG